MSGSVEWELRRLWRIVVSVPSEKTTQPDSLQKVSLLRFAKDRASARKQGLRGAEKLLGLKHKSLHKQKTEVTLHDLQS